MARAWRVGRWEALGGFGATADQPGYVLVG